MWHFTTISFTLESSAQNHCIKDVLYIPCTNKNEEQCFNILTYSQLNFPVVVNRSLLCKRIYSPQHGTTRHQLKFPSSTSNNKSIQHGTPFLLRDEPNSSAKSPRHNRSISFRNAFERETTYYSLIQSIPAVVKLSGEVTRKSKRINNPLHLRFFSTFVSKTSSNIVIVPVEVFGAVKLAFSRVALLAKLKFTFVTLKAFCMPHTI